MAPREQRVETTSPKRMSPKAAEKAAEQQARQEQRERAKEKRREEQKQRREERLAKDAERKAERQAKREERREKWKAMFGVAGEAVAKSGLFDGPTTADSGDAAANDEAPVQEPPPGKEPPAGSATYEDHLAEKSPSDWAAVERSRRVCLGLVKTDDPALAPDDAPWAFDRTWNVGLQLALRIAEDSRSGYDRQTYGWVFEDEIPEGAMLRIGDDSNTRSARERPFRPEVQLQWQEGITALWVEAKAGDRTWKGTLELPERKKEVRQAAQLVLVDTTPHRRTPAS